MELLLQQLLLSRCWLPFQRSNLDLWSGGGAPSEEDDIRLGDVVVSKPTGQSSGVVQYDYGKTVGGGHFQQTGTLNKPPTILLTAISKLITHHQMGKKQLSGILSNALTKNPEMKSHFCSPCPEQDQLFYPMYTHIQHEKTCVHCDTSQSVNRVARASDEPYIHYGTIASANQVMRHGPTRDRLAQEFGILCFEMEAAGLMDQLPCLVVRGICDYADTHKNKQWQDYTAATAAAYTKELLSVVPVAVTDKAKGKFIFLIHHCRVSS